MFDGTDLSLAYGAVYEPQMPQMSTPPPPPPPVTPPSMEIPAATMPHVQPPEVQYAPPPAMFQKQVPHPVPQDSMWEKISQKKVDVLKLFILAMVVLLGISMDRVATHYLTTYVGKAFLSETHEFLVRLSYPVIVLVILWLIKALT
jgi:hypothetical protein